MKSITLCFVCLCGIVFFSCEEDESPALPDSGYIYAQVGGKATLYTDKADAPFSFEATDHEMYINYQSPDDKDVLWGIMITGVDFNNITYPYVIRGPKEATFGGPAFSCAILDTNSDRSPFGRYLVLSNSDTQNVVLTIESYENGVVRGTFSGDASDSEGNMTKLGNGKFLARFN